MMEKEELMKIKGGGLSSTMVNAVVKVFDIIIDLGRSLGSAIRRTSEGKICKI